MGDMLDNRDFDGGGESVESEATTESETVVAEAPAETQQDVTSEENTEAPTSGSEEINNTEESTESVDATDAVDGTTKKTEVDSAEGETTDETVVNRPMSTRAAKRFEKILSEKKELEQKVAAMSKQATEPLKKNEQGEIEMTPDQLNAFITNQVQNTLQVEQNAKLEQQRASAWDDDIKELMETNSELDPNKPEFNKDLNDALIELIKITNVDANGNPVVNKLPSEIYGSINSTLSAAKNAGKKEATVGLAKKEQETAIQSTGTGEVKSKEYSDEDLSVLQATDPREYARLIEDNII